MKQVCVCRFCGNVFVAYSAKSACKDCSDKEEAEFSRISEFIAEHPSSNAIDVAQALNMAPLDVLRYVDEGRLSINLGDVRI